MALISSPRCVVPFLLNGLLNVIASYLGNLYHCERSDSEQKLHHNDRQHCPTELSGKAQPSENDTTLLPDGQ